MGIPAVFQIADSKRKKNPSSSLEKFTTADSTFLSTPPYQVGRARKSRGADPSCFCFRAEHLDGGLRYLSDLQGLQGERL